MKRVKVTIPGWPLERQTPGNRGLWGGVHFFVNSSVNEVDYWVVCENLHEDEETICPRQNTILITHEPPTIRTYNKEYLSQFGTVITCHQKIDHHNVIIQQQALPWHVGRKQLNHMNISWSKNYDELVSINDIKKNHTMSVICSSKKHSKGHKRRFDFAKKLKAKFGSDIDVFGRGIQEVEDKWQALAPYKYHIALENCSVDDYWTEKLSDAFLAGCHPIYYGCPNIERYLDGHSLTKIDITKPQEAMQQIERCLNNSVYEKSKEKINQSRMSILHKFNIFPMICEIIDRDDTPWESRIFEKIKLTKEQPIPSNGLLKKLLQKIRC